MAKVSAILLAAGQSRRMGIENKLLLPIHGQQMIIKTLQSLVASSVDEIILVCNEGSKGVLLPYESDRVRLVENENYRLGMTSSIQKGVAASGLDGYMICLGDQPYIRSVTYDAILQSFGLNPSAIILPFYEGKQGNPALFPSRFREAILAHREPEGCKSIVKNNQSATVRVDVNDPGVLIDIDTKEDYLNRR